MAYKTVLNSKTEANTQTASLTLENNELTPAQTLGKQTGRLVNCCLALQMARSAHISWQSCGLQHIEPAANQSQLQGQAAASAMLLLCS